MCGRRARLACSLLAVAVVGPLVGHGASAAVPPMVVRADGTVQGRVVGGFPGPPAGLGPFDFVDRAHGFLAVLTGTCVASPCRATLLRTSDAGRTWKQAGARRTFVALHFISASTGFEVDGRGGLERTGDAGATWTRVGQPARVLSAADFVDQKHGWVLAATSGAYRTVDGGAHWTRLQFQCGFNRRIARIDFVDDETGYLICQDENGPFGLWLYRSTDGGGSWVRISTIDRMAHVLGSLDFVTSRIGFTGAGLGDLRMTTDGGRHFHWVPNVPDEIVATSWSTERNGYAASNGVLARTDDGGRHWHEVYPAPRPQTAIAMSASGSGVGIGTLWGPGVVLRTTQGTTWHQAARLPLDSIGGLVRTSPASVWVVGTATWGTGWRVSLFHSVDDGAHWRLAFRVAGYAESLSFARDGRAFLETSSPSRLYRTDDGGRSWQSRPEWARTWGATFVSPRVGWTTVAGGNLARTDDGGRHWHLVPVTVSNFQLAEVRFVDADHGWIAGTQCRGVGACSPALLRTRDGGAHWLLIRLPRPFASQGFDWLTPALGYAQVGSTLYRTRDGGITWVRLG